MNRCIIVATSLWLAGCASHESYMGIPMHGDLIDSELVRTAELARDGNKWAQLQLGIAFQEGRGVARDLCRARKLYRLAATTTGGLSWRYLPGTRQGSEGTTQPVFDRPLNPGIEEAKERVRNLKKFCHNLRSCKYC